MIKQIIKFWAPIPLGVDAKKYFLEQHYIHSLLSVKYAVAGIAVMVYIELGYNELMTIMLWGVVALLMQAARYIVAASALAANDPSLYKRPFFTVETIAGFGWIAYLFVMGWGEQDESVTLWRLIIPFIIMVFYMDSMRYSMSALFFHPVVLHIGSVIYLVWFNLMPADVKLDYIVIGFAGTVVLLHYGRASHVLSYDIFKIIQQNKALVQQMDDMLIHDELTKQHNRRYFNTQLSRYLALFQRTQQQFCVAMIDIDYFKRINDTHGHAVGDGVLVQLSAYIKTALREADIFARYGGEEFVLLLPLTDLDASLVMLDRLRVDVAAQVFDVQGEQLKLTISIGVASVRDGDDAGQLLARADDALYQGKENGRNQVRAA